MSTAGSTSTACAISSPPTRRRTPLRFGELWAIPIMLRLALLENLRRWSPSSSAGRMTASGRRHWIERMLDAAAQGTGRRRVGAGRHGEGKAGVSVAFVAEFASRIQGQSPAMVIPMTWLEQRLGERGQTIEVIFRQASQNQAADQLSVGNSIGSLRLLGATDWRNFVEAMSGVEKTLATDPAGVYPAMDFMTRDRYRHVVEEIARRSPLTEDAVAGKAIELARSAASRAPSAGVEESCSDIQSRHVGYFLIGRGRAVLEQIAQMRPTLRAAHQPSDRAISACPVCRIDPRLDRVARGTFTLVVRHPRHESGGADFLWRSAGDLHQSSGHRPGSVGCDDARPPAPFAATGFFARNSSGVAHRRGCPVDADRRRRN